MPIDGRVLYTLRLQLHSIKKCFSGKEFVDKVLEIGRNYDFLLESLSDNDSPGSLRRSGSLGGSHVFSPTGQLIEYTTRYACEVGQFLLKERVLIQLRKNATGGDSPILTPEQSLGSDRHHRHQLTASFDRDVSFESSYSQDYSPGMHRSSTLGSHRIGTSSVESIGQGIRRKDAYQYRYHSRGSVSHIRGPAPEFMNNQTTFYKFTDSEDKEESAEYQSRILVASHVIPQSAAAIASVQGGLGSSRNPRSGIMTTTDTHQNQDKLSNARQQTLFLVFDLLVQRARKEKRAKQFLQTPRALETQGQRRANSHTNCDLIIKM